MTEEQNDMAAVTQNETNMDTDEKILDEKAPEIAGEPEPSVDPNVLGVVEQQEQSAIVALQRQHQQLVYQMGNLELRKFETVNQIGGIEEQIQRVYQTIGKRLNIGPQTRWTIMADGTIRVAPNQPMAVPSPDTSGVSSTDV